MVPKHSVLTLTPVRPRLRYSTRQTPPKKSRLPTGTPLCRRIAYAVV
jgi:hypothetical protein